MAVITTSRLILRWFSYSDAEAMAAVFQDPDVMGFGDGVQSQEWISNWISQAKEIYQNNPGWGPLALVQKGTEEPFGYCGLFYYPDICGQAETEIGYRLAKSCWGFGYATEAVSAVKNYAFDTLGLTRVVSIIDPGNVASVRVAKKVGMQFEQEVMLEGYSHPDHVYVATQ